jgi:hemoglobin-like flavoprotein
MVDRAIALLGPDIDLLTEIMLDLGKQHRSFGVETSFYPPMGRALRQTLQELLGEKFMPVDKEAWLEVYRALSYDMIRGK